MWYVYADDEVSEGSIGGLLFVVASFDIEGVFDIGEVLLGMPVLRC